jgi:[protein-PII] uridylyltransferase
MARVSRPHVLTLAVLIHDVGKGGGNNHAKRGAEIAREIALRLGWESMDIEDVAFLVEHHALMPALAYRRDVKDPYLIKRFAELVETPELLAMLYLLAFADVRSVGPNVWSNWKGALLAELYQSTLNYLEQGQDVLLHKRMQGIISSVQGLIGQSMTRDALNKFFSSVPKRYISQASPEEIASHLMMAELLSQTPVVMETKHLNERGYTELSIVMRDTPGLFAKVAAVLSSNNVNIIDAQIFTLPNGVALDLLWVTDINHKPIYDPEYWLRIQKELGQAIEGSINVSELVERKSKPSFLNKKKEEEKEVRIFIDNDVSIVETVVDVWSQDRLGLLYDITKTLFELGCTIERAKITTHQGQAVDVFYVRDTGGKKITSRERLKEIKEAVAIAAR